MYVCVCNAIRECEFRQAARCTRGDAEEVYASLGYEPRCGSCLDDAETILREERRKDRRLTLVAA